LRQALSWCVHLFGLSGVLLALALQIGAANAPRKQILGQEWLNSAIFDAAPALKGIVPALQAHHSRCTSAQVFRIDSKSICNES
jgi:hypothetical protein